MNFQSSEKESRAVPDTQPESTQVAEPYYLNVPTDSYFEYQVSGITFQKRVSDIYAFYQNYESTWNFKKNNAEAFFK